MARKFSERDEFAREKIAQNIEKLINLPQASPIVIDGTWGVGKTEFCIKLRNHLMEVHHDWHVVYIDAFKYDYTDEPFLAIVSQIAGIIGNSQEKKDFFKKAIDVARFTGATVSKALVSHILKEKADVLVEGIQDSISEDIGDAIGDTIKDLGKLEETMESFRASLTQIATSQKIVLIIDELDRCKPSFALGILEKIKHIFDVGNVSIVISTNLAQIEANIKKQYGHNLDSGQYIAKFFKFRINLPHYSMSESRKHFNSSKLLKDYFEKEFGSSSNQSGSTEAAELSVKLIEKNSHSLRDVEKFLLHLDVYRTLGGNIVIQTSFIIDYLTVFFIYVCTFLPEEMESISDSHELFKIVQKVCKKSVKDLESLDLGDRLDILIVICLLADDEIIGFLGSSNQKRLSEFKQWYGKKTFYNGTVNILRHLEEMNKRMRLLI